MNGRARASIGTPKDEGGHETCARGDDGLLSAPWPWLGSRPFWQMIARPAHFRGGGAAGGVGLVGTPRPFLSAENFFAPPDYRLGRERSALFGLVTSTEGRKSEARGFVCGIPWRAHSASARAAKPGI